MLTAPEGVIALIGATGFTGALCAAELSRRGLPVRWLARDAGRLEALARTLGDVPRSVVSVRDPEGLRAALRGARVVLNTVGPFEDLGEPVVEAALAAGAHYVDTTGEQGFMARILDRYDATARAAGRAVICAGAYEYALGDCLAALAIEALGEAERVDVFYLTEVATVSHGTASSALRVASRGGWAWRGGQRTPERPELTRVQVPGQSRSWRAIAFPCGEAVHVPRHHPVPDVRTWVGLPAPIARLSPPLLRLAPALLGASLGARPIREALDRLISALSPEPSDDQRRRSRFTVAARAQRGSTQRWCSLRGVDPYQTSAQLVVEQAALLLERAPLRCGVVSTAAAFGASTFLASMGLEPHVG